MAVCKAKKTDRRTGPLSAVTLAIVMLISSGAVLSSTITINIKTGAAGPVFEDQSQKTVRAKNKTSRIIWHCNGCSESEPLSINFIDCLDPQGQPLACPADPATESEKKSVFDVNVDAVLEEGTLNYVIKVGEKEVDPSIIVTR